MNLDALRDALTRKYGPLPGYAWAAIAAAALVLVLRRSSSSSSSSPAFLTTPPQSPIGGVGDGLGAGGGGSDPTNPGVVDPAISTGLPITSNGGTGPVDSNGGTGPVDSSSANSTAPSSPAGLTPDAAIAQGFTAADYFAANPLPTGTTTQQALDALGQFPATSYDFGPSPNVDYGSIDTYLAGLAAQNGTNVTTAPQPPAITTTPSPSAAPAAPAPVVDNTPPSMIELHYLHGRDPEQ